MIKFGYIHWIVKCIFLFKTASNKSKFGSLDAVVDAEFSGVVQAEAGVHIIGEVALESVQVLSNVGVNERQCPAVIVQGHSDPDWIHGDPQVWTPAVVKKLVFVPVNNKINSLFKIKFDFIPCILKLFKVSELT